MGTQNYTIRLLVTIFTCLGLVLCTPVPSVRAQAQTKSVVPNAQPSVDGDWPRGYETPSGGMIVVYQPQIANWENQKRMAAYAAVSFQAKDAKKFAMGTLKIEADTQVALDDRLVSFASMQIAEVNFPALRKEDTKEVVTEIMKAIPKEDRVIALDRVLAAIDKSQITPKNTEGIKADPPNVFFSTAPARLMLFDDEPIWSPIKGNSLRFAVNTNWDLFQDGEAGPFYLRDEDTWLKATDLKGTWTPAGKLPDSFLRLPDADWGDVKMALPGKTIPAGKAPAVFVCYEPAEMIVLDGTPKYKRVEGTGLLWVSNTESDIFRLGPTGPFYYLVTGRWFSATDPKGPWTFATPTLPNDFKNIPKEHPRSRVLASVPGTAEAMEAVLLAQVPQTARVNIKQVKAPEVVYQGKPQFQPIESTSLERAINTDKSIIKVGDLHFMCFQGVWFVAKSPDGPWVVATSVPKEIYTIPPGSPVYNVTYVTVADYDDDWAEFVCAAGYTGMMVAWGCAVWGTGYYYPPYVWHGGVYPIYYPHPVTYGCSAGYNPWTGRYGWAAGAYGPYGGVGAGAVYNPRTGTYARGGVAYGPYGAAGAAQAWNPRTGGYASTRQGVNPYRSWGSTYVQRGDDWASTKRYTSKVTGDTTRITRTDQGVAITHRGGPGDNAAIVRGEGGEIYAGKDGNIYHREDGHWQKYDGAGSAATRSAKAPARTVAQPIDRATTDQLDRDFRARAEGAQRTREFSRARSSGLLGGSRSGLGGDGLSRGGFGGGRGRR